MVSFVGPTIRGAMLVYSLISFAGICLFAVAWRRQHQHPARSRDLLPYVLLLWLWPSLWYWPSSIGKESILLLACGLCVLGYIGDGSRARWVVLLSGLALAYAVRPHVALVLAFSAVAGHWLMGLRRFNGRTLAEAILLTAIGLSLIPFAGQTFGLDSASDVADFYQFYSGQTLQGGSNIGIAAGPARAPIAAVNVWLRPFPWEAHNVNALLAGAGAAPHVVAVLEVPVRSPPGLAELAPQPPALLLHTFPRRLHDDDRLDLRQPGDHCSPANVGHAFCPSPPGVGMVRRTLSLERKRTSPRLRPGDDGELSDSSTKHASVARSRLTARRLARSIGRLLPSRPTDTKVLAYHLVGASTGSVVDIPLDLFERHLDELVSTAQVIPLESALEEQAPGAARPRVVLTFDDAFENFGAVAWPALKARNLPATLFVPVGFLDRTEPAPLRGAEHLPPMAWERLAELSCDPLVTIGSHSWTHRDLRKIDQRELGREILDSRRRLESMCETSVDCFCYPQALWTRTLEERISDHYELAVVAGGGGVHGRTNPLRIGRVPIRTDGPPMLEPILTSRVWLEEWASDKVRRLVR